MVHAQMFARREKRCYNDYVNLIFLPLLMFPHAWVTAFFMRPVSLPFFLKIPVDMDNVTPANTENARIFALATGDTLQGFFTVFAVIDGCLMLMWKSSALH